jgi:hypothetical protein
MAHWREDYRRDREPWSPERHSRREDPDEFPGPVSGFGRGGADAAYSGRYARRGERGLENYRGGPGGVSGGPYGPYGETYDDTSNRSRFGGQYEGLSPGQANENAGLKEAGYRSTWRGKGPKGYVRSDDRIREDVCDYLTDDPFLDPSDIEVHVRDGEVTLNGTVSSRADKHYAEDVAEQAAGVHHLQNNLRVREQEPRPASRTAGTSGRPE